MNAIRDELMSRYYEAIEAKLQELVASGVPLARMRLEQDINDRDATWIVVDERRVAEFRLTYSRP